MIEKPSASTCCLDRVRDVAEAVAGDALRHGREQRALGRLEQLLRDRRDRPDRERARRVGDPAVEHDADVDREDVAALELVRPRDPVHDHRVRRGADRAGEAAVALEGRLGALRADEALGGVVELLRRDAGPDLAGHAGRACARGSPPAAAIFSICSGVFLTITASLRGAASRAPRGCGRGPRSGCACRRCGAADRARRSRRRAARSRRGRPRAASGRPRACRRRAGRGASRRRRSALRASAGRSRRGTARPVLTLTRRPEMRRTRSSSGTSISSTAVMRRPSASNASPSASACARVRGKPSRMKPSRASSAPMRSTIRSITSSSGTSSPASMKPLAFMPSSVPSLTAARRMSPVATYGRRKSSCRRAACVPLPAPGGPKRMRFSSLTKSETY